MIRIYISEIDLDILHRIARGMTYKQIAVAEGMSHQTVKNRMANVVRTFGANSMPHLIAILIASAVLYLPDLYQDVDVHVREYKRRSGGRRNYALYQLSAVRV